MNLHCRHEDSESKSTPTRITLDGGVFDRAFFLSAITTTHQYITIGTHACACDASVKKVETHPS